MTLQMRPKESFLELFASRRVGGFIRAYPFMIHPKGYVEHPESYVDQLIEDNHVIYEVRQQPIE